MGGQLQLQTVADSPMAGQSPAAMQQQILHGFLIKGSLVRMGTDWVGPDVPIGWLNRVVVVCNVAWVMILLVRMRRFAVPVRQVYR